MSTKKEHLWATAVLIAAFLGCTARAQAHEFAGGTGEPNDPYQIATAEQLIAVGTDPNLLDRHFALIADIDVDPDLPGGRVFDHALIAWDAPIGAERREGWSFRGVFDGQGHTIRNLHIDATSGLRTGLFGSLSGVVRNLHLTDVVVAGTHGGAIAQRNIEGTVLRCSVTGRISGADGASGLVGVLEDGDLIQCECDVVVDGDGKNGGMVGESLGGVLLQCRSHAVVRGFGAVGGLIGISDGSAIIESSASGTVAGFDGVGGLIGDAERTTVLRCAADCDVTAELSAGGLVGRGGPHRGRMLADSYARGSVTGYTIGGLVGTGYELRIANCYAACEMLAVDTEDGPARAGGALGRVQQGPVMSGCFWDTELSGLDAPLGDRSPFYNAFDLGTGLTTEQMQDEKVFEQAGWDLGYIWAVPEADWPVLRWELEEAQMATPRPGLSRQ